MIIWRQKIQIGNINSKISEKKKTHTIGFCKNWGFFVRRILCNQFYQRKFLFCFSQNFSIYIPDCDFFSQSSSWIPCLGHAIVKTWLVLYLWNLKVIGKRKQNHSFECIHNDFCGKDFTLFFIYSKLRCRSLFQRLKSSKTTSYRISTIQCNKTSIYW